MPRPRFAAVPGEKGGQDIFGAYDVVADWPKDLSTIKGHEGWTFGAGQSVFAESPNRIFVLQRGELPNLGRPKGMRLTELGPGIVFPIGRLPWRDATTASPPGNGGTGQPAEGGMQAWEKAGNKFGVDARWEHCIMIFDGQGNLIDSWNQCDSILQRPHFVAISPYDPQKHVWIVDDHKHVIYKFTNDGKTKVMTIGTYGEPGADDKHFNRPTFMDWFPDGSFVVADGYNGTRVVKFDKDGKYLTAWGQRGEAANELGPATSTTSTASPSIRRRGRCSSTTVAIAARRCSTRTASSSASGRSVRRRPTSTCSTSSATATYGQPIAAPTDAEVRPRRKFHVLVGHVGRLPGRHVGCARFQRRYRTATSTSPRSTTAAPRSTSPQGSQSRNDDRQAAPRRVEIEHY